MERARTKRLFRVGSFGPRAGIALLLAVFYAGCASPSYRRAQDQDRLLSVRVNEAIATALPDGAVQGRAYRGVVVLLGEVSTVEGRGSAETAAKTVRGSPASTT